MDIYPVNERIIVKPKKTEECEKGIIMPDTFRTKQDEKPEVGFIIGIDTATDRSEQSKFKIGDKVIFNRYATTDIMHKSQRYLIMLESSILAIFRDVDPEERKLYLGETSEKA